MKKLLAIPCLILLVSCQDTNVKPDNEPNLRVLSNAETGISTASNDFAFNLFKKVQAESPQNNFISPLSVSIALGMVLNGAAGETQQSILNTIDFNDLSVTEVNQGYNDLTALLLSMDKKVDLGITNSVWYSNEFHVKQTFSDAIMAYYDGKVGALDFKNPASKNTINKWVEDNTNHRIKNLVENIAPNEVMFLINTIYFKGDWTYPFNKSKTHTADFYKMDGSTSVVNMMHADNVKMLWYDNEDFLLLDVPYGNEQFSMTLIVPHQSEKLKTLTNELNSEKLSTWFSQADTIRLALELPKFAMTWKANLKEILQSMGLQTEGFPKIFEEDNVPLEITRVIHQTFLEVNEKGTEAAAATGVGVGVTTSPPPQKITIDKPFLFLIREKHSGAILFMGELIDPASLN